MGQNRTDSDSDTTDRESGTNGKKLMASTSLTPVSQPGSSTATNQSEASDADVDTADTSSSESAFLLSLRQSTSSDFARKRQGLKNPPPVVKRRARRHGAFDPISVTPSQRVKEFPNESLTVSNKRLFCNACREEVGLKSTVVRNYVRSNKHEMGKNRLARKDAVERDIAQAFRAAETEHSRGETLREDQRVYRVRVVHVFLRTATPLNKLSYFRCLLEENALRLANRRQLADLIPFVFSQEQKNLKKEISNKYLSVIFDTTTRLGEAMAIVVQYIDDEWSIQQRLICLKLLQKSMTGEEIAQVVMDTLSREYGIFPNRLLACMRDRAAVNNVSVRFRKVLYQIY